MRVPRGRMHLANPSIHILLPEVLKVQGQPPLVITPDNFDCNVSYPLDGGKLYLYPKN